MVVRKRKKLKLREKGEKQMRTEQNLSNRALSKLDFVRLVESLQQEKVNT